MKSTLIENNIIIENNRRFNKLVPFMHLSSRFSTLQRCRYCVRVKIGPYCVGSTRVYDSSVCPCLCQKLTFVSRHFYSSRAAFLT